MSVDVELISTGAELLSGRTINQHAYTLGAALAPLGYYITRDTTIPDDGEVMVEAIRAAMTRVDIVFLSGGLGPTSDDLTRDAVATLLGAKIVMHDETLEIIRRRYREFGRPLSTEGERQALVVEGADVLPNTVGAAPGERLHVGGKTLFLLPGPPAEFRDVLEKQVLPLLRESMGAQETKHERVLMTFGLGESDILSRFAAASFPSGDIEVAYRAGAGRVEICLTSRANDAGAVNEAARKAEDLLSSHVYATDRIDMEEALGQKLIAAKKTLAVAESCTGGLLGQCITRVRGSSGYFLGGIIAYANEVKIRELDVSASVIESNGVVSEPVAIAMACGVRARFESDYGIGITGIAGPDGGTESKPVGTVCIAVASGRAKKAHTFRFRGDREAVRARSALAAMEMLWRQLDHAEM